jgi:hypothetical protein
MISSPLQQLAAQFWEELGEEERFPRDLELPIHYAKPTLAVVPLARLCPAAIKDWLATRNHCVTLTTPNRWLNGCFYANRGRSFIFVERSLTAECRRLVIAHEFGHFLAHYEAPRRRAERRLGPGIFPLLDGERSATTSEEFSASLAGITIDSYLHFMDRNPDGTYLEPVDQAEQTANELGLELLAPWRAVFAFVRSKGPWPGSITVWEDTLIEQFGLPASWARIYAMQLIAAARGRLEFSQALGL